MKGALVLSAALGLALCAWLGLRAERRAGEARATTDEAHAAAGRVEPRTIEPADGTRDEEPAPAAPAATSPEAHAAPPASAGGEAIGCILYGQMRADDGGPLGDWRPSLQAIDADDGSRSASPSPDGHYSLAGLAPGTWRLRWGGQGYFPGEETIELDPAIPIVRRDLVLARAPCLAVRVLSPEGATFLEVCSQRRSAGLPVPRPPAFFATLEPPGAILAGAERADEEPIGVGRFWDYGPLVEAAGPGAIGVLVLSVEPPVHVSLCVGARVVAVELVPAGAREVTFVVDPAALLASEARVALRAVAEDTGQMLAVGVTVDSRTMYSVRGGPWSEAFTPGAHHLALEARGYARLELDLTLEPGEVRDLGELVLPRELTIEGHLRNPDGEAVPGRLELGRRDAQGKLRFLEDYSYVTDADGRFVVHGLFPRHYVLHTAEATSDEPPLEWVSGNVSVSTLGGSVSGLDLPVVRPGRLALKGAATLPSGALCRLLDEHGELLRWSAFYPGYVPRFALPPGPCTFVVCDGEWNELARHALVIAPGENELDLAR